MRPLFLTPNHSSIRECCAGDLEGRIVRKMIVQAVNELAHGERNPDEPPNLNANSPGDLAAAAHSPE
jgi:hypothetical protein